MAGLSTQEFLNCTHSPLEIVKADPQIKADPGSRVFCFLSSQFFWQNIKSGARLVFGIV
jgi:hypothetical protein